MIYLYEDDCRSENGSSFNLLSLKATHPDLVGVGTMQVKWSPCERYLYLAQRKNDHVLVYDIRQTGNLLCYLEDRTAGSNLKLIMDILRTGQTSHEIVAGCEDGKVRVWKNPTEKQGPVSPELEWQAHDGKLTAPLPGLPAKCAYISLRTSHVGRCAHKRGFIRNNLLPTMASHG